MSTRRSTRERKKPRSLYEVEDRRKDNEEEEEGSGEENEDEDENEDGGAHDDEHDAFELDERKSTPKKKRGGGRGRGGGRPPTYPKKRGAEGTARRLKPVAEERSASREAKPQHDDREDKEEEHDDGGAREEHDDDDDDGVLFEAVARGRAAPADLAADWRARFEEDAAQATRALLNFVLQACGGRAAAVPAATPLATLDLGDVVDVVVTDLQRTGGAYPLASRCKPLKSFSAAFTAFWDALVVEAVDGELLFTADVVELLVDWLTALSSAEVRAVRHTTTVAAYALGSALVDGAARLAQQLAVGHRQLQAETAKTATSKATMSKKLAALRENQQLYAQRRAKLLALVQLLFHGVVVHRYRDVMPELRVESVRVLGHWIRVLPDQFLKDNYLKYLGWVLNDKDASVRLGVVEVLLELYEVEACAEQMELFTSRFLARLLELCNDVDDAVVEACIKLLIAVDKRSLISSDIDLHAVERLVFEQENDVVRKAAAEFVCLQYDAFGVAESNRSAKLTKEQLHTQAIALVEFAEEYITNHSVPPEAVETMVDAFWGLDDCQVLQDWKLLTSLLLADKNAPDLTSEQQTLLMRLLVASIGKITADDSTTDKATPAAKKKHAKEKEELCVTFCKEIPTMLVRFQSDVEKLSLLVELIPLLALTGEVTGLQPTHVKSLLEKLQHAYTAHSEVGLLKSLSLSIHHLRKSENEVIKRESDVVIHELLQGVLDKLDESLEEDEKLSAEATDTTEKPRSKRRNSKKRDLTDSEYAVRTALVRLQCLISHLCVREFLPQTQQSRTATSPGVKQRRRVSTSGVSMSSRMEKVTAGLVSFVRRRTKNVSQLDRALLQADAVKAALSILFSDVLWLTRPVFTTLAHLESDSDASSPSQEESMAHQIEQVVASRSQLEEAITAVLEMHLTKVERQRTPEEDGDDATEEAHIEMEEIPLDDPKVALFVKEAQRGAFLVFCDARCLFVEKFKECAAPFNALDWPLSKVLVLLTQMYFENEMQSTPEEQPEGEEPADGDAEAQAQQSDVKGAADRRKVELLVALGRVSHSNPSNKRQAAAVLRYLVDGGRDSQEVVRAFSKHIKAEAPVRYLEVQMTALRQLFATVLQTKEELQNPEHQDEAAQEELEGDLLSSETELKELAKKLSQTLGVGKIASSLRAPFFRFLCEGVRYALEQTSQFSFLEILRPYMSHLDKSSTKQLNAYFTQLLEELGDDVPAEGEDIDAEWRIVFEFQSLISDPDGVVKSTAAAAKALKRKAKLSVGSSRGGDLGEDVRSQVDEEDEADGDAADEPPATPSRKRRGAPATETSKKRGKAAKKPTATSGDGAQEEEIREIPMAKTTGRNSTPKRKLQETVEEEETPQKKSRPVVPTPTKRSSGKITQLSDDEEEEEHANEDEAEPMEVDSDEEAAAAAEEAQEEEEEEDVAAAEAAEESEEEIDSRRSRRRGLGRK